MHDIEAFKDAWQQPSPTMTVHTSGSTGKPKEMQVEKIKMWDSARTTIQALGLQEGNTALLCMPLKYIAGQMVVVRSFAGSLQLMPVAPTAHPYAHLHEAPDFAALTPMQVYESLKVPHERSLLRRTLCLIIGGGVISPQLEAELRTFPNPIYSTYGMTETLSHIALRRVMGLRLPMLICHCQELRFRLARLERSAFMHHMLMIIALKQTIWLKFCLTVLFAF